MKGATFQLIAFPVKLLVNKQRTNLHPQSDTNFEINKMYVLFREIHRIVLLYNKLKR